MGTHETGATGDDDSLPADEAREVTLAISSWGAHQEDGAHTDTAVPSDMRRPWRAEMARWQLTLNPGRTQDEYAKAVSYFFEAPGAPQNLDDISPDLLLAYRGALALRAERTRARRRAPSRPRDAGVQSRLQDPVPGGSLPGGRARDTATTSGASPLAPATVNLRLTALRQFLRFSCMREPLPGLTVERIHAALRRLPIERRRPYQILSEEEWPAFLAAARAPLVKREQAPSAGAATAEESTSLNEGRPLPHSPWGATRAQRHRQTLERAASTPVAPDQVADDDANQAPHPRDGRTGARTALRDYALVSLALATGLRAIELSLLDVGDITRERRHGQVEWWLTLPDSKTKGQRGGRTLPLAPALTLALLEYVAYTGRSFASDADRATPLFLALANGPRRGQSTEGVLGDQEHGSDEDHHRLRPEQIRSVINRVETQWMARQRAEQDGVAGALEGRRISPHALRHSAAIALLKGSEAAGRPPASVEHVRGWLGHFDIRTTQRYLDHLNSRDERRRFAISPNSPSAPLENAPGAQQYDSEKQGPQSGE
ncbi:MAG TPA: site-specific integrase [Ktedonobacterales bacterium]